MRGKWLGFFAGAAGAAAAGVGGAGEPANPVGGTVEVRALPGYHLVCVEQRGGFQGDDEIYDVVLERLLAWALPKGLWDFPGRTKLILVYPDDPNAVPSEEQRLWMGITVPEGTEVPAGMFMLRIDPGEYAVGSFELAAADFGRAWGYLSGAWIPAHGYLPAEGFSFEIKKNDSDRHPEKKHLVDICIPVRRAEEKP